MDISEMAYSAALGGAMGGVPSMAQMLLGYDPSNQVPGMGSTANAGGFTSGQMRSRPEDRLAFDYFGFVPGHGPMPAGMPGTQGGPAPITRPGY